MLTGPIEPLPRTRQVDRSDVAFALWEQHPKPNAVELPWPKAASFNAASVATLMANAKTVVVADSRGTLLEHVLAALRPGMRVYAYGMQAMEGDRTLAPLFKKATDRMLVRLGYEVPAHWIVVDGGRAGVMLVGPPGEEPRWAIPLEPVQARSLFEAFRILFWFHARREGLPDAGGNFAFRPPLPAPYGDPGKRIALPAGCLVIDGSLNDLVPDAEFRIVPDGGEPGRAATVVTPPRANAFSAVQRMAVSGTRLVWTDAGLPRTTITRQRMVMDMVAAPVAMQLEWNVGTAVDVYHRINKACEAPKWTFHAQRRLRDIAGPVLLEGATSEAVVQHDERIPLPDVRAPLATFELAAPQSFPDPSPLAKNVIYSWRTVPEVVPVGAGKAQIVKQWMALDEWAIRSVDILQQRLSTMEREERGFLDRLKGFWSGQNKVQQERTRIRITLLEIAEKSLSQRSDAADVVRTIGEEAGKIRGLLQHAHGERQKAEDGAEEREQRDAWQARVKKAEQDLAEKRVLLGECEGKEPAADAAVRDAEARHHHQIADLRAARLTQLTDARDRDVAKLAEVKAELEALNAKHGGKAPKDERKPLTAEVARLEQEIAATKRDIQAIETWSPAASELTAVTDRMKEARDARFSIRKNRTALVAEVERCERAAREEFAYRAGTRLPAVTLPNIATAPTVPTEALPNFGELFEHQGERFLAVRTWDQVTRETPAASRLRANLVAFSDSIK